MRCLLCNNDHIILARGGKRYGQGGFGRMDTVCGGFRADDLVEGAAGDDILIVTGATKGT